MKSRHLTLRIDETTLERLDSESRRSRTSRSQLARELLDEGLRMQEHPGIVFRPGPTGRRPGLAFGPDIWEVARIFHGIDTGDERIERAAELTGITLQQARTALRYYAEFTDEIDEWIRRVDEEAVRAEEAWQREQALLER